MMTSPCKKICRLDAEGLCIGCGRTLAEIADWTWLSDAEREEIMRRLAATSERRDESLEQSA
ncbi:MAG: DUF1289 domain-containing protein [Fimbriimonadaceae bacterium]